MSASGGPLGGAPLRHLLGSPDPWALTRAMEAAPEVEDPVADGRYRLLDSLGAGGMARVYLALDTRLGNPCAIKMLSRDLAANRALRTRFEAEARTMALLSHRNILRVTDVGDEGGRAYIAMELMEGGTLADRIEVYGRIPARMAVDVAADVLAGLQVAHCRGVVHRDIKLHNVMVSREGQVKVTDFGIARVDQDTDLSLTRTGSMMGTWGYMAPEQRVDPKRVDARADLYSVGALLYALVTGAVPVDLFAVDLDPGAMDGIEPGVAAVIRAATRYRRDDRYQDAVAMSQALGDLKSRLPAPPPDTPPLAVPAALRRSLDDTTASSSSLSAARAGSGQPTEPSGASPARVEDEWMVEQLFDVSTGLPGEAKATVLERRLPSVRRSAPAGDNGQAARARDEAARPASARSTFVATPISCVPVAFAPTNPAGWTRWGLVPTPAGTTPASSRSSGYGGPAGP